MTDKKTEYALLAANSYAVKDSVTSLTNTIAIPDGWVKLNDRIDDPTGFTARAYRNTLTGEIAIAYTGTTFEGAVNNVGDWLLGNLTAGSGAVLAPQVIDAAKFYLDVLQSNPGANITFTGHSLGGGLASLMAVYFNRQAVVFDEAPFKKSADSAIVVNGLKLALVAAGYTLPSAFAGYIALDPLAGAVIPSPTRVAREGNVSAIYIKDEILSLAQTATGRIVLPLLFSWNPALFALSLNVANIAGSEQVLDAHATNGNGWGVPLLNGDPVDLHYMPLLTAFLQSPEFLTASQNNPEVLQKIFTSVLNFNPSDARRNFLNLMVQRQTLDENPLGAFAGDIGRIQGDIGTSALKAALVELSIDLQYVQGLDHVNGIASGVFDSVFKSLTGGIQIEHKPEDNQWVAKGFAQLDTVLRNAQVGLVGVSVDRYSLATQGDFVVTAPSDGKRDLMLGGTGNDTLNGGDGNDLLIGGAGTDTLDGGADYDTYVIEGSDTIQDSDGRGVLIDKAGNFISGAILKRTDGSYVDLSDPSISVTLDTDLTLTLTDGTVAKIKNYRDGDLGLQLVDTTQAPTTLTINGDIYPTDINSGKPGIQVAVDALGNPIGTAQPYSDILRASAGNDHILSGSLNDDIRGGDGDDWIEGGSGNDYIWGDIGNDRVEGGAGSDILLGGDGNDRLYANTQMDTATAIANGNSDTASGQKGDWLSGNAGNDTLIAGADNDVLAGGAGADLLIAGAGDDFILGDADYSAQFLWADTPSYSIGSTDWYHSSAGTFNWTVTNTGGNWTFAPVEGETNPAGGGADTIYAGEGNDHVWAGEGDDVVYGEGGDDELIGEAGNDILIGGAGDDIISGDASYVDASLQGNDYLDGGDGNDTLDGGGGDDTLIGGAGDDKLYGGEGANYLDGGDGNDTLNSGGPGSELFGGAGNDDISASGGGNYLDGEDGNDTLVADGGNNNLFGGAGDDNLSASGGNNYLDGEEGNNTLYADGGGNTLFAGAGDDTLSAGGGNSYLDGGDGTNTLIADGGGNTLFGGAGNDTLSSAGGGSYLDGGDGNDTLIADTGNNTLLGGAGDDTLSSAGGGSTLDGGDGNDILVADGGGNTLLGGAGDDQIQGGDGNDNASGGEGGDTIFGQAGDDVLAGDDGNDELQGGDGNDSLDGGSGDDILFGQAGNDTIFGGSGDDYLEGGVGADYLAGGEGFDTYYYRPGDGVDTIVDSGANVLSLAYFYSPFAFQLRLGSLMLDFGNGDAIHLEGFDPQDPYANNSGISEFRFVNTTLAYKDIIDLGFDITGTPDADVLVGTGTNDRMDGLASDDVLMGGKGNDTLAGGEGADTLVGGTGNDVYIVDAEDTVIENAGEGYDTAQADFSYTLAANVEELDLIGTDAIDGTGNALDNVIRGNAGDNVLLGLAGNDTIYGFDADSDYGTYDGNDWLQGGDGADFLYGGTGSDTLEGGAGDDTLIGDGGYGGDDGDNLLLGGEGNDRLYGGAGNDTLDGGTGADFMRGGAGDDTYIVDNAGDIVAEAGWYGGDDTVYASVSYSLSPDVETLILTGPDAIDGAGNIGQNTVIGNDADNTLTAYALNGAVDVPPGYLGTIFFDPQTGAQERLFDRALEFVKEGLITAYDLDQSGTPVDLGARLGDTLVGGAGNDTLLGDLDNDTLIGGAGNDLLFGFGGADTLIGGTGDDTYVVDQGYLYAQGVFPGAELIYEDHGADALIENPDEGTDTVLSKIDYALGANFENLTLLDTTGAYEQDIGVYGSASDNLDWHIAVVGIGNELDNVITGNSASNELYGNDGSDTLIGGAGDDLLDGGSGADFMAGGSGDDTYEVDDAGDVVSETEPASSGIDLVESQISYTLGANVENLSLFGDTYTENLSGTGNELDNVIIGNDGDNVLTGNDGNDTLYGNGGDDTLDGGAGNDILDGGAGDDFMTGGAGDDTYYVDSTADVTTEAAGEGYDTVYAGVSHTLGANIEALYLQGSGSTEGIGNELDNLIVGDDYDNYVEGGAGNDVIEGNGGNDEIYGDEGNDIIDGGTGADYLSGGAGNDTLDGGQDGDTMEGGAGDDTYYVDNWGDSVYEAPGEGHDTVNSTIGFALPGAVEDLTLVGDFQGDMYGYGLWGEGNELDNRIVGSDTEDYLSGQGGDDLIDARAGSDYISGGEGNDTLYGGDDAVFALDIDTPIMAEGQQIGTYTEHIEILAMNDDRLYGEVGNDAIDGGSGNDQIYGDEGDDHLYGGDDGIAIAGERYYAAGGEVGQMFAAASGGDPTDQSGRFYIGETRFDQIDIAGPLFLGNDDYIDGGDGNDTIDGGSGDDTLYGGDGNDTLYGGTDGPLNTSNNDYLDGGAGIDYMAGGTGDDTYVVDGSYTETTDIPVYGDCGELIPGAVTRVWTTDTVVENANQGYDIVYSSADFTLPDNVEDLYLQWYSEAQIGRGNAGDNVIYGNNNDNRLEGGAGNDSLYGDEGNDVLDGGAGDDLLVGGAGDDVYNLGIGSGHDTVINDGGGFDIVHVLNQLTAGDISVSRGGNDVVIGLNGTQDRMVLSNWFGSADQVSEIDFCDGLSLDANAIADLANAHVVTANDDSASVQEDAVLVATGNVLDNDTDSAGHALLVANPGTDVGAYGTLALAADGSYTYTLANDAVQWLAEGEAATDVFGYESTDAAGVGSSASLAVTILGQNDAPTASFAADGTIIEGNPGTVLVAGSDQVVNGGFEQGFNNWNINAAGGSTYIVGNAHSGSLAFFGYQLANGVISQDVPTVEGTNYALDFWVSNFGYGSTAFDVSWNGQTLASVSNAYLPGYTDFHYDVIGAADASHLEFDVQHATYFLLDDVSAIAPPMEIPTASSASGVVVFSDVDLSDSHTISLQPQAADYLGSFDAQLVQDSTGSGSGSIGWNFLVGDSAIDYLAEGQTLTQNYDVTIDDGHAGGSVTQTVAVNLFGTNDAPVITDWDSGGAILEDAPVDDGAGGMVVPAAEKVDGAMYFSDVDLIDTHSVTVAVADTGYVGSLDAVVTGDSTGTGLGSVGWEFSVDNSAIDFLAEGETLEQSYNVVIDDGHAGGTAAQTVTVLITGANDAPSVGSAAGAVTQDAAPDMEIVAGDNLVANGGFENGDLSGWNLTGNTGQVGVDNLTSDGGFAGLFGAIGADTILSQDVQTTAGQEYLLDFRLMGGGDQGADFSVSWNGATLAALADVSFSDYTGFEYVVSGADGLSHLEFALRDDPDFWRLDEVTVRPLLPGVADPSRESTAGAIAFADPDLSDVHDMDAEAEGANYVGEFSLGDLHDSTGTGAGSIDWSFTVEDSAIQYLAEGESLTQYYDVTVYDDYTSTTGTQPVTVTINGANDAPEITYADSSGDVVEDVPVWDGMGNLVVPAVETVSGEVDFSDVDLIDTHSVTVAAADTGYVGSLDAELMWDSTGGDYGWVGWTFAVGNSDIDYLAEGQLLQQTYNVTVDDGHAGGTATQTVTVSILGANDAPVTQDDAASAQEDVALFAAGNVLANDSDVDHGTVLSVAAPGTFFGAYGILSLAADGSYSYALDNDSPEVQSLAAGQQVTDSFGYAATDGIVATAGTLELTIIGTNDAPVTADDAAAVQADGTLGASGNVLANDSDIDQGALLSVAEPGTFSGSYGTLTLQGDGGYDYLLDNASPAVRSLHAGEVASDAFSYAASDGIASTPGSLVISVTGSNDAPVAIDDSADVREDVTLTATGNVLANDTDADHGTVLALANPGTYTGDYGTLTLAADGSYTYSLDNAAPAVQSLAQGQTVADSFGYDVTDGDPLNALTGTAFLTVNIAGTNDAPVTADDAASVQEDVTLSATGNVLANDSDVDAGTLLTVAGPGTFAGTYGTLTLAADGGYSYALNNTAAAVQSLAAGQSVTDAFAYAATDGIVSTPSTLTMTVTGTNDAPVTTADTASVQEDVTLSATGNVLANDHDVDADTVLAVAALGSFVGAYGSLTLAADGSYSYALNNTAAAVQSLAAGQSVTDAFAYAATDGIVSTPGTLTMTVTGTNDAPVTTADTASVQEDVTLSATGNVLANDHDVDAGTVLSVATPGTSTGTYGSLTLAANGSYTYALNNAAAAVQSLAAGQSVTDAFAYAATDGIVSTPSTLTMTVTGTNDAPVTTADTASVQEDVTLSATGNVLANDHDVDAGTVLALVAPGSFVGTYGSLSLAANGSYTYTLANASTAVQGLRAGQTVTDSFGYAASDGIAGTPSTLSVSIAGSNDAPVALNDTGAAREDGGPVTLSAALLLANDTDVDAGDTKTVTAVTNSAAGALVSLAGGNVVYDVGTLFQTLKQGATTTDTFTYTMADGAGAASSATVAMTITGANDAPVVANPIPDQNTAAGSPFNFTLAANTFFDIDAGDSLSYTATLSDGTALPSWLSFNAATRTFTGTPPGGTGTGGGCGTGTGTASSLQLRVNATDTAGASAFDVFALNISGGSGSGGGPAIIGTDHDDVLAGTPGNDIIDGRLGFDRMSGGKGDDVYYVDATCGRVDQVVENPNEGYDTVYSSADYTLTANVEELHLIGRDDLTGHGNALNNIIVGNTGDNALYGEAGDDLLMDDAGNDTLYGGAGNDVLDGGAGDDTLTGGAGNDTYVHSLAGGDDVVEESGGQDTIRFGEGIAASAVSVLRDHDDLVLKLSGQNGSVTVKNWFSGSASRVERVQFSDGSAWNETQMRALVSHGSSGGSGGGSNDGQCSDPGHDDGHSSNLGNGSSGHGGDGNGGDRRDDGRPEDRSQCGDERDAIAARLEKSPNYDFTSLTTYLAQHQGGGYGALTAAQVAQQWRCVQNRVGQLAQDDEDARHGAHGGEHYGSDDGLAHGAMFWGYAGSTGQGRSQGDMASFSGLGEGFTKLG